jgi:glutamate racemase
MPTPIIGVFDSGFGGLTVLRALLPLIPGAHYIYLGDTARLPYGSKSRETIARYAVESAKFLHKQGADLLVIACNTATALALEDIQNALPIPVIGVVEPGAQAARAASAIPEDLAKIPVTSGPAKMSAISDPAKTSVILSEAKDPRISLESPPISTRAQVLVLATAATVQSHAYTRALNALGLEATEKACPLLVPLVEEGWTDHAVTREVVRIYLSEALQQCKPSAVLLGCTHYPLIADSIEQTLRELGSQATIIDSAQSTARITASHFPESSSSGTSATAATFECYATDSTEKFARLGSQFLGQEIQHVHHLDLGG